MESQRCTIFSEDSASDDFCETNDRILLRRAIYQKDRQAQEYIYVKFKPFIRQSIKNMGSFNEEVDDLVQEIFVNICKGKCQYSGKTDVRGYLCGMAKKAVRSYIRATNRQIQANPIDYGDFGTQISSSVNTPEKTLQLKEVKESLYKAIAKLPAKSRKAVELVLIHRIRPYQAAAKADCSPVVFRKRLQHGLKKLRKDLRKFPIFFEP